MSNSTLLRPPHAFEAAQRLLSRPTIPALAVDPAALEGNAPRVLVLADAQESILLDASAALDLTRLLAEEDGPIAAEDAKLLHRCLFEHLGRGPSRWACCRLTSQLLAAGAPVDTELESVAASLNAPAPPDANQGLAQLAARAKTVAAAIAEAVPRLREKGMIWVSRIEAAAVASVAEMESAGMPFDANRWQQLSKQAAAELQEVSAELNRALVRPGATDLFGGSLVNLSSDQELKRALHELGFPVPNTRRATLARLPPPIGPLLLRFRELGKLTSTYGEAFLNYVDRDGRIRPRFEQIGATTGRMACHSPNLQAVVKDDAHRACFRAAEGRKLVVADYAACELRILAELSGDPVFAEAFSRGDDLHARVASEVFGVTVSKREHPELRERAKAINFGLAYGMGAGGLARTIGADLKTAEGLLERYFERFPLIGGYLHRSAREALERGFASTPTGRRLTLTASTEASERAQAERIAKNMPIQGTSADITKLALARVRRCLGDLRRAFVVNTVHDEIVVECEAAQANEAGELLRTQMEEAGREILRKIPVAVDVTVSQFWSK